MSGRPRIRDVVEWRARPPVHVRMLDGTRQVLEALLEIVSGLAGGAPVSLELEGGRVRVPDDTTRAVRAGRLTVRSGTAAWMPGARVDRPTISMTSLTADVVLPGGRGIVQLDLDQVRLEELRVPSSHGLFGGGTYEARLAGPDMDVRVTGPWIAFAWLGHLGGWPDPQVVSLDDEAVAP